MSLDLIDPSKTSKSFWEKKEGTTGMIVIAGALACLVFFGAPILAAVTTLAGIVSGLVGIAANTVLLSLIGLFLFVIGYTVTNRKFQTLCSFFFEGAMRKLTGAFVEIDPIGIMKTFVQRMTDRREQIGQARDKLKGQIKVLDGKIETIGKKGENAFAIAALAQKQGNTSAASIQAKQAIRMEKLTSETMLPLKTMLEAHLRVASKLYEVTGILIEDTKNEVEAQEIRRDGIMASYSVIKAAKAIMSGSSFEKQLYDQAMEFQVNDLAMKVGEIESFIEDTKPFIDGLDLQNGVYAAEGLARLQAWEAKAESTLLGSTGKAQLLEHSNVAPMLINIGTPAGADYANLINTKK
jgi:hypothetical protein